MIGQYAAVLIAIIMALVNTISVIAQSQNETNETIIVENQSVSGNTSAFGVVRSYDPRTVDDPAMVISGLDRTLNETEVKQNPNASKY
jgi:hypothetical protein